MNGHSDYSPDALVARLIPREGGFVNHPDDPGGATKWGITLRTLQGVRPGATVDDLRLLTPAGAAAIYRRDYLDGPRIGEIEFGPLRELVFDCAVNHGVDRAVKWLQAAANVAADGVIGPKTLAAVNGGDGPKMYRWVLNRRMCFYGRLITDRPKLAVFAAGWMKRAGDFAVLCP